MEFWLKIAACRPNQGNAAHRHYCVGAIQLAEQRKHARRANRPDYWPRWRCGQCLRNEILRQGIQPIGRGIEEDGLPIGDFPPRNGDKAKPLPHADYRRAIGRKRQFRRHSRQIGHRRAVWVIALVSTLFPIHFIHFQAELSILDAVILELTGYKNDKIAIQQLEKVQNATGKLLEKVQKV